MSREVLPFAHLKETYNPTHEVHRYRLRGGEVVAAVSAQTWPEFINHLSQIGDDDNLVVSPELMTFTGQPLVEVDSARQLIETRVNEVRERSKKHPNSVFLLGTPTFPETGKPRNSVVYIRGGEIIGCTNKRSAPTYQEREYFDLPAEEPPALVPGTSIGVLICADLATTSLYLRLGSPSEQALRMVGRASLIGKKPTFIHPKAKSLVLPSCWGVGGMREFIEPGNADSYYRAQLRAIAAHVLRDTPVQEIVVSDRVPVVGEELKPSTPTKPCNAFLERS